jgi:predicted ATPase
MLLHGSANGRFSEMIAEEGGMPSVLWAGQTRGSGPVQMEISVSFDHGLTYSVACGLPDKNSVPEVFRRDPQIKREQISIKKSVMVDRNVNGVSLRASDGEKVHLPMSLTASESVLAQIVDPERFPAITNTRNAFASWRFYHGFRSDEASEIRQPQICSYSPVLAADGKNVASAILTIHETGDRDAFDRAVYDALGGSRVAIEIDSSNRARIQLLQRGLSRPLEASELSDGTLRYICLLAALLSPRPPRLIGLNEPETSLHPDVLPALARLIADVAKQTQVWMVTHAYRLAEDVTSRFGTRPVGLVMRSGATETQEEAGLYGARLDGLSDDESDAD